MLLAIDSLIKLDSKVKDHKYETLFKGITNFLHAVKLEFDATYLGQKTILGLARALLNHIQYTLAYYEKDPPDRKQQEKIDLSVCPLFDITRRVIKANPKAKDMCRTELLKTRM